MGIEIGAFLLLSIAIIVIPGPNVMVIVATSLSRGPKRGMQTVAGTSLAMLIQLVIAGIGTGVLVNVLAQGLIWLKWAGVAYLIYLGVSQLFGSPGERQSDLPATVVFNRGFLISLTNPKTILFFSAFLPQFVSPEASYGSQIAILSLLFWLLAMVLDSAYALLAAQIGQRFPHPGGSRAGRWLGGFVYLGASAALASSRQA
ncbi:MAG: LysE family translocator [Gammaproteobacteria bacterium]|nr:LysE family translocator [Gammaproteobacteria bacterium]